MYCRVGVQNKRYIAKTTKSKCRLNQPLGVPGKRLLGSLTIEAALVIPIFLMFVAALIHVFIILSVQNEVQVRVDETARDVGKRAYLADDSVILSLANSNFLVLEKEIANEQLTERLNRSCVINGGGGIHATLSSYDSETGELDVCVTYKYKIPYLPVSFATLNIKQRCFCRAWIGENLETQEKSGNDKEKEGQVVYITPSGTVYHITKSCPFLDLSIRSVPYSSVASIRNRSNGKYYRCGCAAGQTPEVVYITDYGTLWHTDISCTSLKRTVIEIDISQVGGRNKCSKCGGEH